MSSGWSDEKGTPMVVTAPAAAPAPDPTIQTTRAVGSLLVIIVMFIGLVIAGGFALYLGAQVRAADAELESLRESSGEREVVAYRDQLASIVCKNVPPPSICTAAEKEAALPTEALRPPELLRDINDYYLDNEDLRAENTARAERARRAAAATAVRQRRPTQGDRFPTEFSPPED